MLAVISASEAARLLPHPARHPQGAHQLLLRRQDSAGRDPHEDEGAAPGVQFNRHIKNVPKTVTNHASHYDQGENLMMKTFVKSAEIHASFITYMSERLFPYS